MYVLKIQCDTCDQSLTYTFRPIAIRGAKDPGRSYHNLQTNAIKRGWMATADKHICPKCSETTNVA